MSGNPLNYICQDAFSNCQKLTTLRVDNVQFKNPNSDLSFLASLPGVTVSQYDNDIGVEIKFEQERQRHADSRRVC